MILFPAIDLVGGKAVRLLHGDYEKMTVYGDDPAAIARDFRAAGATAVHVVDLEGAKNGDTPNLETVRAIVNEGLFTEVGGGVRSMETVETYLSLGVGRVILGTAAVTDRDFLRRALDRYGEKIAVGVDLKNGNVAIHGWTETAPLSGMDFLRELQDAGVQTVIVTDISKDGALQGANRDLYSELCERFTLNVTASGGVSSLADVQALAAMGLYGAIIGKAYYTGALDLKQALEVAQ